MTVEELIKILEQYPQDAQIFVSHLCMGWIDKGSIEYDKYINAVKFM
jgi:hypothetical protein